MPSQKQLFFQHIAATTNFPLALEVERAQDNYFYEVGGKKYLDFISGIAVSNLGHGNEKIKSAIKNQVDRYMHLMVYGELVQSPQVELAELLVKNLSKNLNCVYFGNSGAEAIDGAMKLAKRFTGRTEIIAFKNAYHGSTQGPLSIMGDEHLKQPFRPLLPDTSSLNFNQPVDLEKITYKTAAVFVEPIQGEAGTIPAEKAWLKQLKAKCQSVGALLVFDEIQTGMGRTGSLFCFQQYDVEPDIICLAKALGGGMPLGAFIASKEMMLTLAQNPMLGHLTTFGGHPVSCAAGLAALKVILEENYLEEVNYKENLIRKNLTHPTIKEIRGKGLMLSVQLPNQEFNFKVIDKCLEKGLFVDWFLFNDSSIRIAPPLTITEDEIQFACNVINTSIEETI